MRLRFLPASLLVLTLGLGLGFVSVGCKNDNLRTLTVDEVAARVAAKDGHTFVYDDNPQDRYAKGHVPGAKWLEGEPTQADLPSDKGATLIFYCASEL